MKDLWLLMKTGGIVVVGLLLTAKGVLAAAVIAVIYADWIGRLGSLEIQFAVPLGLCGAIVTIWLLALVKLLVTVGNKKA